MYELSQRFVTRGIFSVIRLVFPMGSVLFAAGAMLANAATPPSSKFANLSACVLGSSSFASANGAKASPAEVTDSTFVIAEELNVVSGAFEKGVPHKDNEAFDGRPSTSPFRPRSSVHGNGMRGRPTLFGDRMVTVSFRIPATYATRIEEHSQRAKECKSDFFRRAIDLALRDEAVAGEQEKPEELGTRDNAQ